MTAGGDRAGRAATGAEFGPYDRTWTPRDCIIYALGVGAGPDELAYATDTTADCPQQAIPTFAINQGLGGGDFRHDSIIDPRMTVHAGHRLQIHRPMEPAGTVHTRGRVLERLVKASGELVTLEWESRDPESGALVSTNVISYFDRGTRAEAQSRPSAYELGRPVPDRPPDSEVCEHTLPTQALLYRCSGDPNLIHTDPAVARAAGFKGPILHGLCTLGFATRAVLRTNCAGDTRRLRSVECRFVAPGYPGDALVTSLWAVDGGVAFRTRTQEGTTILDRGLALVDPPGE